MLWDDQARARLMRVVPWQDAEQIDRAVEDLARDGHGAEHVARVREGIGFRLHVGPYRVRFVVDQATHTLSVLALYRYSAR